MTNPCDHADLFDGGPCAVHEGDACKWAESAGCGGMFHMVAIKPEDLTENDTVQDFLEKGDTE